MGETRYSIKAFPFGGSCAMLGEDEEADEESAFGNKSVWARIAVVAGGLYLILYWHFSGNDLGGRFRRLYGS